MRGIKIGESDMTTLLLIYLLEEHYALLRIRALLCEVFYKQKKVFATQNAST